jgi:hypothetical protein
VQGDDSPESGPRCLYGGALNLALRAMPPKLPQHSIALGILTPFLTFHLLTTSGGIVRKGGAMVRARDFYREWLLERIQQAEAQVTSAILRGQLSVIPVYFKREIEDLRV